MGKISEEDIRGIYGSKGAICIKCMTPDDFYAMKQNEIITDDDIALSDDIYFCDRCNGQL